MHPFQESLCLVANTEAAPRARDDDTPKMNVGIYARVSTDKQDNGNQLEQLREFASRQGWAIAVEYVDTVTGSGRKTRPQFERMLLAASQRKFDLLLFWALDRLSREGIVRTLGYLEQLRAWNIGWRSYTQPFLDTGNEMTNGIVLSVLSAVAQQERITLSERTKAGLQRAKRAGRKLGRRAVEVDMGKVHRLRAEGLGLCAISAKLGISVNTLQKARGGGEKALKRSK
jgi:DNA invertase Pin-like site-specific DNA recombinase